MFRLIFCFVITFFPLFIQAETVSIPVQKLSEAALAPFLPQIQEELAKEFALQNDGRTQRFTRE